MDGKTGLCDRVRPWFTHGIPPRLFGGFVLDGQLDGTETADAVIVIGKDRDPDSFRALVLDVRYGSDGYFMGIHAGGQLDGTADFFVIGFIGGTAAHLEKNLEVFIQISRPANQEGAVVNIPTYRFPGCRIKHLNIDRGQRLICRLLIASATGKQAGSDEACNPSDAIHIKCI